MDEQIHVYLYIYINIQEQLIAANSSLQIYMHNDETDLFTLLHKEVQ